MEPVLDRKRRLDVITRWVAFSGFFALIIVAVATSIDVTSRYFFSAPIDGLDDIAHLVFAIVVAGCFPAGLLQGHNITIRFFGKAVGPRVERFLEVFGATLTLIFFILLAWQFALMTLDYGSSGRNTMTVELPIAPWWWVTTSVIMFCVPVQLLVLIVRIWEAIIGADTPDLAARQEDYGEESIPEHVGTGADSELGNL